MILEIWKQILNASTSIKKIRNGQKINGSVICSAPATLACGYSFFALAALLLYYCPNKLIMEDAAFAEASPASLRSFFNEA